MKLYSFQVYSFPRNTVELPVDDDGNNEAQRNDDGAFANIRVFSNMIPVDIGEFKSLKDLSISVEWSFMVRMRIAEPLVAETTKSLSIHMSHSISCLPSEIGRLYQLEKLELDCLDQLTSLPLELGSLTALENLRISRCHNLICLPESISKLALKSLSVEFCSNLNGIPPSVQRMKLQKLRLIGLSKRTILKFFSHSWNESGSLEQISIHECKLGENYQEILSGLPLSLSTLSLKNNDIENLEAFLAYRLPPKIRKLSLNDNPILNSEGQSDRLCLERLIDKNPQLGDIGWWFLGKQTKFLTPKLQYKLLFNRCGRILLNDAKSILVPLWPTVLEGVARAVSNQRIRSLEDRIADCRNAMEPSVLYSLLHGPALLNRQRGLSHARKKRVAEEDNSFSQVPRKRVGL